MGDGKLDVERAITQSIDDFASVMLRQRSRCARYILLILEGGGFNWLQSMLQLLYWRSDLEELGKQPLVTTRSSFLFLPDVDERLERPSHLRGIFHQFCFAERRRRSHLLQLVLAILQIQVLLHHRVLTCKLGNLFALYMAHQLGVMDQKRKDSHRDRKVFANQSLEGTITAHQSHSSASQTLLTW